MTAVQFRPEHRRRVRTETIVLAALLCLVLTTPGFTARSNGPPFTAAELFEQSVAALEPYEHFFTLWHMTMSVTIEGQPAPDVKDFVTEMHVWLKQGNFRHEIRMPEDVLAGPESVSPMAGDGVPACIVAIVRQDLDVMYCQTFDGGWQVHRLADVGEAAKDVPHFLAGSPEEMGVSLLGLEVDEWEGQPAWRIDGDLNEAMAAAGLPFEFDASISIWIDRGSMLLLATESRLDMPEQLTDGDAVSISTTIKLVEFDPEADIPDALFEPPAGVAQPIPGGQP